MTTCNSPLYNYYGRYIRINGKFKYCITFVKDDINFWKPKEINSLYYKILKLCKIKS